jgi:hypothetical protein
VIETQPERMRWEQERTRLLGEIHLRQRRVDYLEALLLTEPMQCSCPEGYPRISTDGKSRQHTGCCPLHDEVLA